MDYDHLLTSSDPFVWNYSIATPKPKTMYSSGRYQRTGKKKRTGYTHRYRPRGGSFGLQQERKFFDDRKTIGGVPIIVTGNITNTTIGIPRGDGESERIGRSVRLHTAHCRFTLELPIATDQADIPEGDIIRIMMIHDKQCNGATPPVLDVLEDAEFDSYMNLSNSKRFTILYETYQTMNRQVAATDGANTSTNPSYIRFIKFSLTNLNIIVDWEGATGALTELTSTNVFFLYITANGQIAINEQITRWRYDG